MTRIFAVNPGATSTKLAAYDDGRELWRDSIDYTPADFAGSTTVFDQLQRRRDDIMSLLRQRGVDQPFDATAGRGGLVGPVKPGAYVVDDDLIDRLRHRAVLDHASNLGGALAREVAREYGVPGCPAYIYDPVTADSMMDIARLTGIKGLERRSIGHHLNMRAVAIQLAEQLGTDYRQARIIVVHMGGGSSASAHAEGEIIDFVSDDEIQFSAERSGGVPLKELTGALMTLPSDEWGPLLRKKAGLVSHCGTTDMRAIEARVSTGDEYALLVVRALALQIGKCVASLAVSMEGRVDGIILTGGMAHSELLSDEVRRRVEWIAPFHRFPGEAELNALAAGALRVVRGQEMAHHLNGADEEN